MIFSKKSHDIIKAKMLCQCHIDVVNIINKGGYSCEMNTRG